MGIMKKNTVAFVAISSVLFVFFCAWPAIARSGENYYPTGETIRLSGKLGIISLFLEAAPSGGSNVPPANRTKISLIMENGKIKLIGDRGFVAGVIGDTGFPILSIGKQEIGLYSVAGKRVGSIGGGKNSIAIIGDSGRVALLGENGKEIGYIGENGRIVFQK